MFLVQLVLMFKMIHINIYTYTQIQLIRDLEAPDSLRDVDGPNLALAMLLQAATLVRSPNLDGLPNLGDPQKSF